MALLDDLIQAFEEMKAALPEPWTIVCHKDQADTVRKLLEGHDVKVLPAEHVEPNMAYMFHEGALFDDTSE